MFFNRITALAICLALSTITLCQKKEVKIKFGDIKAEDFKPQVYSVDSSADAVYLYTAGSSYEEGNNNGAFSVVYKIHERIRLLHKKSFDKLATVNIPLFKHENDIDKISDLHAATYNIQDGKVITTNIEKNSFFKDKDGDAQIVKFTFPNLNEGCIIEYSYTKTIPFFAYIPSWSFQNDYPALWSEYSIEIPQFFDFVVLTEGYLKPAIDTASLSANTFNVLDPSGIGASRTMSIRSNTIIHKWAFANTPAIKEEKYITTVSNYIQKLEFQLSAIRFDGEQPVFYMNTWYETADKLLKAEYFGQDLSKENGWLKDDVKTAVAGETNAAGKAKNIYEFVRDNYSCTDHSDFELSQPLKKIQQSKKGNVADINLLLTAMLRNAGFDANPVLLSTRDHGKTYDIYPILDKFNYVICQVNINDKFYLLDAADPVLGFGKLGADCYNGDARIIATNPLIVNLSADSLHESETTSLFLMNDSNGKVSGTYNCSMGQIQSINMREKLKQSSPDDYFKDVKKSFSFEAELNNAAIDSLKKPDMPIAVRYDISFKPEDDIVYFNPMFSADVYKDNPDVYKDNPFNAAQRLYPVEMPYCIDKTYILNMAVPAGYKVDELPKSSRVTLNEQDGMFEYLIQQNDDQIQMRCRIKLNKANFDPEDYETLRNFFAFVVEKENEQIVFKKQ